MHRWGASGCRQSWTPSYVWVWLREIWAAAWQNQMTSASSEHSDQPGYTPSLISRPVGKDPMLLHDDRLVRLDGSFCWSCCASAHMGRVTRKGNLVSNGLRSFIIPACNSISLSETSPAPFEPRHNKTNKMTVLPAKTQISLGIRTVWSESSLSAWRNLGPLATHWAQNEDSDQTGRMPRLIWVFAGRIVILLVLSCRGSFIVFARVYADVRHSWKLMFPTHSMN